MTEWRTGFSAPSSSYPGATISLECTRYMDGDALVETAWAVNVLNPDGSWVAHPDADHVQSNLDSLISMLAPFCEGETRWTADRDGRTMTFFDMVLSTWPDQTNGS